MWLLLYSVLQGDLDSPGLVNQGIALLDLVIKFYIKSYPIQHTEYIHAEYLIMCKALLTSWKTHRTITSESATFENSHSPLPAL